MPSQAVLAALLTAALATGAFAPIARAHDASPGGGPAGTQDIVAYGMNASAQRFSPLTRINRSNVHRLVPKWALSLNDARGIEGQPVLHDGLLYVTTHDATIAVNALTGKQVWRASHEYAPETLRVVCCGIVNRGAVVHDGKVIRALLDDQVVALDAKTGKEVWKTQSPGVTAAAGYSMTGAPLVARGVVIVGAAGAEYGVRGFIEGYDAQTGRHLWRHWNVPADGEPGRDSWPSKGVRPAGGSAWVTGSYDPQLNLVYWGVGNPSPWNPRSRPGDNLYTDSILALRPETGELVWHYQTTPNDPFDYDGVNQPVLATLQVAGSRRRVVMQANRNGFLYVLDAASGKPLAANKLGTVNWAEKIDLESGRPVVTQVYRDAVSGNKTVVWPDVFGVASWNHLSFNPASRTVFINTLHWGMEYQATEPSEDADAYPSGKPSGPPSIRRKPIYDPDQRGFMKALDPVTGAVKWQIPLKSPNLASVLSTAGGLVFTGVLTGEFEARDAESGKLLWSFQTPSGIVGQPITWAANGKQYVTVPSGIGGLYALRSGDPNLANVPGGSSIWTFELFDAKRR